LDRELLTYDQVLDPSNTPARIIAVKEATGIDRDAERMLVEHLRKLLKTAAATGSWARCGRIAHFGQPISAKPSPPITKRTRMLRPSIRIRRLSRLLVPGPHVA